MAWRPDSEHGGSGVQAFLLLGAALVLAVLIAVALTQWFGRLS